MKKFLNIAFGLTIYCISAFAQADIDSTDVFFRHLKLNEIVVTGVTGDTKLAHSTMPISVISWRDLRQTPSVNIIDAIARQPGMAHISTGVGISKPIIRGLGFTRVVTMNDGVRQEGQQWGDEHGIEIDPQTVHSVEILKGPASLMYGSDALAGVLIMHSSPILAEGDMRANVSTEYHSNNGLFAYSLNFAANKGGLIWDLRYSDKHSHPYKNKYDGYVPGSQFKERAGRLMLGLNRQWGHSHLIWSTIHQTPSIITGDRDEATGLLLKSEDMSDKTYRTALPFQEIKHYKAVWDNMLNLKSGWLKAVVSYQQNRRQEYEESSSEYEKYFRLHTVTYDLRYLTQEFSGWKLTAGANGMWQKSENLGEEALIPEYKLFDFGAYTTASKTLGRLTFNGGMRYDHRSINFNDRRFNSVTGSVGSVWNATEYLNIRLNIARGYRAPNISELAADGVHEGTMRYELGNADLKPEYSWQADLGIDFNSRYMSAQVALFANRIDNYVFSKRLSYTMEEGLLTYQYTQGDARLLGFEAGIDLHPIHNIHFENTFSMVDAQQLHQSRESRYLPMTPAPRWNSELKYEITHQGKYPIDNAYVAFAVEYNFKQNHYYMLDNTETATPAYTLLNLSAGGDLLLHGKKVAELYLTGENLLNTAYQNHLDRLKYTDLNTVTGRQGVYAMGRNIILKVVLPITF